MRGDVTLCAALRCQGLTLATRAQVWCLGGPDTWDPSDPCGMALQATGDPILPGHTTLTMQSLARFTEPGLTTATLPGHTALTEPGRSTSTLPSRAPSLNRASPPRPYRATPP